MRSAKYMILLATLTLGLPLSAWARPKNEHNLTIYDPVQVGSTQLKPGDYKVEWQGTGQAVQVRFLQYGKTVATTQGKLVEEKKPSSQDDVVTVKVGNAERLEEIDFEGNKDSLVITSDQTAMK